MTPDYELGSLIDVSFNTSHSIALVSLTPQQTYHFRVSSTDGRGNIATSEDFIFTYEPRCQGPIRWMTSAPRYLIQPCGFHQPVRRRHPDDNRFPGNARTAGCGSQPQAFDQFYRQLDASPDAAPPDTDFEVEAKFESPITANYQMQGIWLSNRRSSLCASSFSTLGANGVSLSHPGDGTATTHADTNMPVRRRPMYLRVTRAGNWTVITTHRMAPTGRWPQALMKRFIVDARRRLCRELRGHRSLPVVDYFFNTAFHYPRRRCVPG